ncbi:hypothetical protein V866_002415 [Kwoniella sp. B9012]
MIKSCLLSFFALLFLVCTLAQTTTVQDHRLVGPRAAPSAVPRRRSERDLYVNNRRSGRGLPFKRSLCSTNAECLRKGLPLLKPVRRATGTRALRPRQSDSPEVYSGGIQVFNSDGNSIGYISKNIIPDGGYDLTTSPYEAVSLLFSQDGSDPFTITISSNDRQAGYPYLGGAFNDQSSNIGSGSSAFALLSGISKEISGTAQPDDEGLENTRGLYGGQETAIFLYNPATQAITGRWTNTDSSKQDTIFFNGSGQNYGFGMIAQSDYQAFTQDFDSASPQIVTFKYVTLPSPEV